MTSANLLTGWLAILAAILSGAVGGLFFYRDDWMGGYNSYRRRLARLGHVAFAGMGFLNIAFAISASSLNLGRSILEIASASLIVAAVTMPVCCFLAAWRKPLRQLFPIPVLATLTGILAILTGWRGR